MAAMAFTEGNELFVDEDYEGAVEAFSRAISESTEADVTNANYYAKRAAAYLKLKQYEEAMDDAVQAIKLNPIWIIFALMTGAYLSGFVGVLISLPIAAILGVVVRHYFIKIF